MDVLLDYTYEMIIPINDIVENRTPREVFQSVLRDVALDLRSAVGVAPQRPYGLGESGLSKMVLSLKRVDPAGIAHGSWDVVVGTVGAAEDTAVGVIRLTWQGVIVTGKAVGSTKVAKVTWRGVVSVGRFVALQGERFYRWLTK